MSRRVGHIIIVLIILSVTLLAGLFLLPGRESVNYSFPWAKKNIFDEPIAPSGRLAESSDVVTEKPVKLIFFGDAMVDRSVGSKLKGRNLSYLLGTLLTSSSGGSRGSEAGEIISSSSAIIESLNYEATGTIINLWSYDLVGANLEGAVTNSGLHYLPDNAYDFAFSPERINEFKQYGFNYFSLANNHLLDQGKKGVSETRENLDNLQFNYSGDVDAQISSSSVTVVERQQKKIALISLSMIYHDFDLAAARDLITAARISNDVVVVNIHWGTEYQHQFSKKQQTIGRALIDSGADMIIGHHPHVVQGMEIYQGRPIFYSLGNFIFDQYFSPDTQEGLAVGLELESDKIMITSFPLQSRASVVSSQVGEKRDKFFSQFISWSSLSDSQATAIRDQNLIIEH